MNDDGGQAPGMSRDSPFHTTPQAARYLNVPEGTLARMRRSGTGPRFRRHGRIFVYHIDDLDRWSEQQVQPATGRAGD